MDGYTTLEQDLVHVFEKRGIKVKTIEVAVGALEYKIELMRRGDKENAQHRNNI